MSAPSRLAPAARSVAWGQAVFFAGLLVCVAIDPHLVLKRREVGISNFGVHWSTVVPYSVAFAGATAGLARAARLVRRPYAAAFAASAACFAAALVTTYPYHLDVALKDLHDAAGIATLAVTFALGLVALGRAPVLAPVVAAHVVGMVVGALTLVGTWHLLFLAQVLTSAAFSVEAVVLAGRTGRAGAVG